MEMNDALTSLAALSQETRLSIFRLLVQSGPAGLPAGQISNRLAIAGPTLSFHLKELKICGLTSCRRDGRSLIYAANFAVMGELIAFLTDDCCDGHPEVCALSPNTSVTENRTRKAV